MKPRAILLSEAGDAALLARFREIAKHVSVPGWKVSVDDLHGKSWLRLRRADGAEVRFQPDWRTSDKPVKKLEASGEFLRGPRGHLYGTSYDTKYPKISLTLTPDADPKKFAKRLSTAVKNRFLPKYLLIWDKGLKEKEGRESAQAKREGGKAALIKEFGSLLKTNHRGDKLGLNLDTGYGDLKVYSDDTVSIDMRSISMAKAKKVLRALK
jgi:hypothetical protein